MQCAKCNATLSSESQFCPKCGAPTALTSIIVNQQAGTVNGQMIGVVINYHGKEVAVPTPEAFAAHRAALADKPEYQQWAGAFFLSESGKSLPLYASPYDDEKSRRYERRDLLETIRDHERLLILGEPGMGKTVALQRMMWETAARAEPALTPIFVPLNDFRGDLLEPVRVALCETGVLRLADAQSARACLEREHCLILFDGLNETPGKWRSEVVAALGKFMREFPRQRYVITSRLQDPLWEKLRALELIPETVVIQAITAEQICDYLAAHLGEADGIALYNRLNERLLELARTPLLLWMIQKIGRDTPELPKNRGKLFELFVKWILEREKKLETETPPEIQKQALRCLAFSLHSERRLVCPRTHAEQLVADTVGKYAPETVVKEALVHHLLEPAQATDGPQVKFAHQFFQEYFASLDLDLALQAEKQMPGWLRWMLGKRRLAARARDAWWMETFVQLAGLTGDADWLALELARTGNSFLAWWCIDEGGQVSEATRRMVEQNSVELLDAAKPADRRRTVMALSRLGSERVLPLLLFAAGDEAASVFNPAVQALLEQEEAAQPVVKQALGGEDRRLWRAARRCLRRWPEHSLWAEVPAAMWDEMLEPADRRLAVKAWVRLKQEWTLKPLWKAAGDDDLETANLAAQALTNWGELVSPLIGEALRGEDRWRWRAALRCLAARPDDPLCAEVPGRVWEGILGQPLVWVPPGPFQMGREKSRDPKAYDNELPQHELTLSGYWIGRYPVTVAQWRNFVNESGHTAADTDSLKDPGDHPVRYINWHDALAFCYWWSEKTGLPVTLPSEAEWEKAARGTDGRLYPWGDAFDQPKCNTSESDIGTTTPVGKYSPQGDSPYGCSDMAGNTWEWTRSKFKPYPSNTLNGRESLDGGEARVLRGGSWLDGRNDARASSRYYNDPYLRSHYAGFRVVVRSPSL